MDKKEKENEALFIMMQRMDLKKLRHYFWTHEGHYLRHATEKELDKLLTELENNNG